MLPTTTTQVNALPLLSTAKTLAPRNAQLAPERVPKNYGIRMPVRGAKVAPMAHALTCTLSVSSGQSMARTLVSRNARQERGPYCCNDVAEITCK